MELGKRIAIDKTTDLSRSSKEDGSDGIFIYSVPVSVCLGLQYLIPIQIALLHAPICLFSWLSLLPDDPTRGEAISKILFLSGISSILQSLVGGRSPVMIAPSIIFIFAAIENFKTNMWERLTDGDLYAMGPSMRNDEFLARNSELCGLLVVSSFSLTALIGLQYYFRFKLPPSTISATVVCACFFNMKQLLSVRDNLDNSKSSLVLLVFGFLLFFLLISKTEIPFIKVISSEDHKIKLRIFKVFGILFTFIICLVINVYFELDFASYLERTLEPHSWLSHHFIPKDFTKPKVTFRVWLLFPAYLSQALASYCCYGLINRNQDRQLTAFFIECLINIISPLFGLFLPLGIELSSLGLWCSTEMTNNETTVISGSLLLVISAFLQVISLCSYAPYTLILGVNVYLYGKIISNVLEKGKEYRSGDMKIVSISVLMGMMVSFFTPELLEHSYYDLLLAFIKTPVLMTFCISLLLNF